MMNLDRTLIVAPHPDDDVIAAGGLIQRVRDAGGQLRIVFVTDGENNPWPQRYIARRWTISSADREAWGGMRRIEALCSLSRLGVPTECATFLALPDQGLAAMLRRGDLRLMVSLREAIADFRPTFVVTPSTLDVHSDHRAAAWATHKAAGETPIVTYVIHGRGDANRLVNRIELTDYEQRRKLAAIECHHSQLILSRDRFLSHVRPSESFYQAEFDRIRIDSAARDRLAMLRHSLRVAVGSYPDSRVQPAAHVQDRPGDVPGLL